MEQDQTLNIRAAGAKVEADHYVAPFISHSSASGYWVLYNVLEMANSKQVTESTK